MPPAMSARPYIKRALGLFGDINRSSASFHLSLFNHHGCCRSLSARLRPPDGDTGSHGSQGAPTEIGAG